MDTIRLYSWFWLLLAPVVLGALWWRFRPRARAAAVFSSVAELKDLAGHERAADQTMAALCVCDWACAW